MDFNEHTQRNLLSYMITDPVSFAISQTIINPDHFDDRLRPVAKFVIEYADKFRALPTTDQIEAATKIEIKRFDDNYEQHTEWYLQTIEEFSRHKALEMAVLDGVDLIQKGNGAELEHRVREAMTISLMRDLGTDYFADPLARIERIRDKSNYISTGWKTLDEKLYGGFTRGALNVFAGGSGSGKSLFLQNLAINWVEAGFNVIYISLELSEELVSLRLDAMVSGFSTKNIFKNMKDVALRVHLAARTSGTLIIKKMPEAGTTANDIRAFLKEYEIKTGNKPDALIVDYLDLMHPNNNKINPTDLFVKDKYTSEEMRAIAGENGLLCVTASQLNRQSVEASEFDHSHIAGGISKINTADNVFGIFASKPMKERGLYQLQFLKTRSAAAVGQKLDLHYDQESLRISDLDAETLLIEEQQKPADAGTLRNNVISAGKLSGINAAKLEAITTLQPPNDGDAELYQGIGDLMSGIRSMDD